MKRIDQKALTKPLRRDLLYYDWQPVEAYEVPCSDHHCIHIAWLPDECKAGLSVVGGLNDITEWYIAETPEAALDQYIHNQGGAEWPINSTSMALEWMTSVLCVTLDEAGWLYEHSGCPHWSDPGFQRYPFRCSPAFAERAFAKHALA